jgi:hypothetical protein
VAQICWLEDGWNHDATQARSSPARIHFAELFRESCTSESPLVFTRSTAPCMDPDSCTPDSRQDHHSKARFRSLSPPFIIRLAACRDRALLAQRWGWSINLYLARYYCLSQLLLPSGATGARAVRVQHVSRSAGWAGGLPSRNRDGKPFNRLVT